MSEPRRDRVRDLLERSVIQAEKVGAGITVPAQATSLR
jgi:hypothetical protein